MFSDKPPRALPGSPLGEPENGENQTARPASQDRDFIFETLIP